VNLTEPNAAYTALRESAAWLDLSSRGVIRVTGEDRARLLHAMTTAHVKDLTPGEWRYAFFLSAQGRILADANILCREQDFLIDTEPGSRLRLYEHLDKFIIADDVILEDLSETVAVIGLEGPRSAELAAKAGLEGAWPISSTGAPGLRFIVPKAEEADLIARLESAGAVHTTPDDANAVRLENARPRYGDDISGAQIPHEVRLMGAVHFTKGCYIGQEIVERVRSRGHVNRLLTHLAIPSGESPAPGTALEAGGVSVGAVASAAYSPAERKGFAFGYIRAEHTSPGAELTCGGVRVIVTDRYREIPAP
jgi:aminomethyltransferase